jgi:hypothetical protein
MKTFLSIIFWIGVGAIFGELIGSSFGFGLPTQSMEPTMVGGDIFFINRFEKPEVRDIIAFTCHQSECGTTPDGGIAHRLVSINQNGCMHIEGDNQPDAYDTKDYGCLMPSDISIDGVVYPLTWINNRLNR